MLDAVLCHWRSDSFCLYDWVRSFYAVAACKMDCLSLKLHREKIIGRGEGLFFAITLGILWILFLLPFASRSKSLEIESGKKVIKLGCLFAFLNFFKKDQLYEPDDVSLMFCFYLLGSWMFSRNYRTAFNNNLWTCQPLLLFSVSFEICSLLLVGLKNSKWRVMRANLQVLQVVGVHWLE